MIRVIKRYESRKLYDTEESRYISLEDIALWVREGQEVKVIDNASSEDVTPQILTQIILDEGKRGTSFLPTELLHELVRMGEKAITNGVEQVQTRVDRFVQRSIDRLGPVRQAREEMVQLRGRLADLEKTLIALEREGLAPAPPAGTTALVEKPTEAPAETAETDGGATESDAGAKKPAKKSRTATRRT